MSNSSLKWSALIYGRTYEVDFRLIAMPKYFDFDVKARTWAENYILATTQIPEKLSGNPRWSLFTNGNYCVFATTCMVKELFPNDISQETKDITTDFRGRPLYAFIGYVARKDEESGKFPPLPAYSDLKKLEQFQLSYQENLEKCWDLKPYQSKSKEPILTREEEVKFDFTKSNSRELQLNQDPKKIRAWSEEYQSDVWNSVVQEINQEIDIFQQPISVCLGLSSPRDADKSPFLNATVLRLDTSIDGIDLEKYVKEESPRITNQGTINNTVSEDAKQENNSVCFSNNEYYDEADITDYSTIRKMIFGIVIYTFQKSGFDIDNIIYIATAKLQDAQQSLRDCYKNRNLDGIYEYFKDEWKSFTYDKKMCNKDIEELTKMTSLDKKDIKNKLKEAMGQTSEIMKVINEMCNFVLKNYSNNTPEKHKSQNSNTHFGLTTIKVNNSKIDGNQSKDYQSEANPNNYQDWF
ncbi:MAG: hypothetical protein ACFCUV_23345 [Rivularia sp. (in: cyanobacteria)]